MIFRSGKHRSGGLQAFGAQGLDQCGHAVRIVGAVKQQRLVRAAQHYLMRLATPPPCRFDVVAIDGGHIEWLRGAFDAG